MSHEETQQKVEKLNYNALKNTIKFFSEKTESFEKQLSSMQDQINQLKTENQDIKQMYIQEKMRNMSTGATS